MLPIFYTLSLSLYHHFGRSNVMCVNESEKNVRVPSTIRRSRDQLVEQLRRCTANPLEFPRMSWNVIPVGTELSTADSSAHNFNFFSRTLTVSRFSILTSPDKINFIFFNFSSNSAAILVTAHKMFHKR